MISRFLRRLNQQSGRLTKQRVTPRHLKPSPTDSVQSDLPALASLPRVTPKTDYESTLSNVQEILARELRCPTSKIFEKSEPVYESEYPESFHFRGGLQIECGETAERTMAWVRRELRLKGYRDVKVMLNGEGQYGSFTVTVKKPDVFSDY